MADVNYTAFQALTREKYIPILVDNIYRSNILAHKLLRNPEEFRGKKIITPLEYAETTALGWYGAYDVLDTTPQDPYTAAEWNPKRAYANITLDPVEVDLCSGEQEVLNLLKNQVKSAERSLKELFADSICANAAPGANEINCLFGSGTCFSGNYTTIDDGGNIWGNPIIENLGSDPTVWHAPGGVTNAIASYDRAIGGHTSSTVAGTKVWWNARMASGATEVSGMATAMTWDDCITFDNQYGGATQLVKKMIQLKGILTENGETPDLIVTTQVIMDAYKASLMHMKVLSSSDEKMADAGFPNVKFEGATMVADSHVPAGQMGMFNTNFLDFYVLPSRNFTFEDFRKPVNQDAMMAKIYWVGQLTCTNPRMQGILVGLPTSY